MDTYKFLLDLALILLSTKVLGLVSRKFFMPQVVGALLAGLILGPGVLDVISQTDFINKTAEVGVIVLMYCAGMETDVQELKKSGKASVVIALMGVIIPLAGGYAVAMFFNRPGLIETNAACSVFLQNIFIGVILTATSVSITVEALKEPSNFQKHHPDLYRTVCQTRDHCQRDDSQDIIDYRSSQNSISRPGF